MKNVNSHRIPALILAIAMIFSMVLVFTVSGSAAEDGKYIFDVGELDVFSEGKKSNGDYERVGTDDYFTVIYGAKNKVEVNAKPFDDGLSATKRIAFAEASTVGEKGVRSAVMFRAGGKSTVKLWWVCGEPDRYPAIFDETGKVVDRFEGTIVKNQLLISEFEVPAAGVYYIGNVVGSNYFYHIEVIDDQTPAPIVRSDWSQVTSPEIKSAEVDPDDADNLILTVDAVVGDNGGDELLVHMYLGDQLITTKGSVIARNTHYITFSPETSGEYTFKCELVRNGESVKAEVAPLTTFFSYPLRTPLISSVTSKGEGTVEIIWNSVHEAVSFNIYCDNQIIDTIPADRTIYMAEGLTIGKKCAIVVEAVRGEDSAKSAQKIVTVTKDAKRTWATTIYGPSTDNANNGIVSDLNEKGSVTVYSQGGKGKFQPTSTDGLTFYYTAIPDEYNFTLRAKMSIETWKLSNGQEGFGLLVTDRIGPNGDSGNFWTNQYMVGCTKIVYWYDDETETAYNSGGAGTKYDMKLGLGTVEKTGMTKDNLSLIEAGQQDLIRFTTTTLETAAKGNEVGTYNVIGGFSEEPAGTLPEHFLLEEFILEITRNNTGYFVSYYDDDGNLISRHKYYGRDKLSQLDEDYVYAGFFASRNARVTFSDVELTTILPENDLPAEDPPVYLVSPTLSVASGSITTSEDYKLMVNSNVKGTVDVFYGNETIAEDLYIDKETRLYVDITLDHFEENDIKLTLTPDPDQELDEFEKLSSTRTVYFNHTVTYNRGNTHRKTIYVSPDVPPYTTTNNGSKEHPFDIYTAVDNASPGQTIILMEGTYKLTETLKIQRGIDGKEGALISMIGDPDAKTRPVLDFQKECAGIVHGGNYWYFRGFDVTNSANMQKGFQVSGSFNILDQIHTYENGNSGIQISRLVGTDLFPDWPSNNLVLNCTSYRNYDKGFEDADGFAAKLTIGEGNVFDGCIAYHNADDGWDLYAKMETGSIGSVTIRNCVAFENGFVPGIEGKTGNGNGFKMGGDSLSGKHVIENSIAFNNHAKGIDSNSCPDIIVKDCISFNNGSHNVALYTNNAASTAFVATGIISFRTKDLEIEESLKPKDPQVVSDYLNSTTFYWRGTEAKSANSQGLEITADMFVSLEFKGWSRNEDGSLNLGDFLKINDTVPAAVANCKLGGMASKTITLPADEAHDYSDEWYQLNQFAHWYMCECGDKAEIASHTFEWIIDKEIVGTQPGLKHEECTVCGYQRAAITTYPEDDTDVDDNPAQDVEGPEELGFFARIWRAIVNFFRRLFGAEEISYVIPYRRLLLT